MNDLKEFNNKVHEIVLHLMKKRKIRKKKIYSFEEIHQMVDRRHERLKKEAHERNQHEPNV